MESLLHDMPKNLENFELTNGVILELKHFLEKNGKGVWELACLIPKLIPSFLSANTKSIVSKITRICDQKKKLISKKKIPGYKNISDLMSATFEPPVKLIKETSASVGLDVHEIEYNDSEIGSVLINSGVQTDTIDSDSDDEAVKSKNLVQYTTYKLEKRKRKLEREIDTQKEKLKTISTKIGHYSIRNVNKRDEKSKQNTKLISELRRTVRKQNVIVNEVETQRQEILTLRAENEKLKEAAEKQNQIQNLLQYSQKKKLKLQKKVSSQKNQINELKVKTYQIRENEIEP